MYKTAISLFIFLLSVPPLFAHQARASEDPYIETLLKRAEEQQIYKDRYWEVLLHYKHTTTGTKSPIDDPRFFLSPEGKRDPKKELEGTIRGFFQDEKTDEGHPRCRFVARYAWLKERLAIDESRLPPVSCKEFDEAYSKVKPKSAVLVFPAAYVNGPASTFGHTLIRIDSDYQSKLLSYAATYAAFADDTNGVLYAFKGIFGFYKGYFTILPYYDKIKEYNDLEQRDIWEYRLNLSEEEVSKMLLHLWELKDIYSDYYFFDENCSYTLLYLFEAARPSLHLTDEFGAWVIPIDTLRAVKREGLVESVEYRPSKGTRIRYLASLLEDEGKELSLKIAERKIRPDEMQGISQDEKIKVLDLATEVVQLKYNKKRITKDEYQRDFLNVLKSRSQLGRPGNGDYRIPEPVRPEDAHGSSRLSFGIGMKDEEFFQEARFRGAQHELSDPDGGYIEGSEIVFLGMTVRNTSTDGGARLEGLDLINIVSISPRNRFFKPVSWKVKTGLMQKTMSDGKDEIVYHLNPGGGFAFKNDLIGLYYLMLETDANAGSGYRDKYSIGIGPSIGVIKGINGFWKMNLFGNAFYYGLGENHSGYKATAEQVVRLSQNNSLNLGLSWKREFETEQREVKINWNVYF